MSKSILIVDDEPMARKLLRLMLKGTGLSVFEAEDGHEALEMVRNHKPDIMILDVMMPGMDGLEVCRTLRSEAETAELPIIIISAKTTHTAIRDGMEAGANKYLTKPVGFKELLECVKEFSEETVS